MELTTERDCDTLRMVVAGEVDLATGDELRATGMTAIDYPECQEITVDLSAVTFIDSIGIGVLVDLHNAANKLSKHFALQQPSDRVTELLKLVGLDSFFTIRSAP